jgi:xanthine dehydrogenase small subunit
MNAVSNFARAMSAGEALAARRSDPSAQWLAGGTLLLAGDDRDKPASVIDVGPALPRGIEVAGDELAIGACSTFGDLAGWAAPSADPAALAIGACLAEAALTMVNRNTRNRATAGGNLGADKSCSSLVPILLVLGAEVEVASPSAPAPRRVALEAWLSGRERGASGLDDLLLRILVPIRAPRRAAYRRWNRVSCDLSVLGAAAALELRDGRVSGLRVALGGLGPRARRSPPVEALFEGSPLPSREEIEAAVAPLLRPIDDLRASAAFKRLRGSQLVAEALIAAASKELP